MYYYPGYARLPSYRGAHGKQGINSCRYPFTTPGLRETIVDKVPCLGAHALSGTRTRDPLITSREHEAIHYSASTSLEGEVSLTPEIAMSCFIENFTVYMNGWGSNLTYFDILFRSSGKDVAMVMAYYGKKSGEKLCGAFLMEFGTHVGLKGNLEYW